MPYLLLDGRMLQGYLHGIARYTYMLAEHMALGRPEWQVRLLDRYGAHPQAGFGRVAVRCAPLSLREQWELPLTLGREDPDLFHATSIAVPRFGRTPMVVTVPDLTPIHYPRRPWLAPLHRLYLSLVLGPVCRRARRVITYSSHAADDACRYLQLPQGKVEVIPLGVDPLFHRPADTSVWRSRFGDDFFLCISNPKPHKNLRLLLHAWQGLTGCGRLVLVTPDAPWLNRELEARPDIERVFPVVEDELPGLIQAARALVLPSLYEGFGLPILEAMAGGTPVLAARAASLPEVVGNAGLLFDPFDALALREMMRRVYNEPALRAELSLKGKERAMTYTWSACGSHHLDVYRQAIGL